MAKNLTVTHTGPTALDHRTSGATRKLVESILVQLEKEGDYSISFITQVKVRGEIKFKPLSQVENGIKCRTKPKGNNTAWEVVLTPPKGEDADKLFDALREIDPRRARLRAKIDTPADIKLKSMQRRAGEMGDAVRQIKEADPNAMPIAAIENFKTELEKDLGAKEVAQISNAIDNAIKSEPKKHIEPPQNNKPDPSTEQPCNFGLEGEPCGKPSVDRYSCNDDNYIAACREHKLHPCWVDFLNTNDTIDPDGAGWITPKPVTIELNPDFGEKPVPGVAKCHICNEDAVEVAGTKGVCLEHVASDEWHEHRVRIAEQGGVIVRDNLAYNATYPLAIDPGFATDGTKLTHCEAVLDKALIATAMVVDSHGDAERKDVTACMVEQLELDVFTAISKDYKTTKGVCIAILKGLTEKNYVTRYLIGKSTTEGYTIGKNGRERLQVMKLSHELRQAIYPTKYETPPEPEPTGPARADFQAWAADNIQYVSACLDEAEKLHEEIKFHEEYIEDVKKDLATGKVDKEIKEVEGKIVEAKKGEVSLRDSLRRQTSVREGYEKDLAAKQQMLKSMQEDMTSHDDNIFESQLRLEQIKAEFKEKGYPGEI